jgi:hypothetical protein
VVSILYLDIEGAFPNMVTNRLLHNMRKRRVPKAYVKFGENLLMGRRTELKFENYTSDWFELDNCIGQGDPLLMILYLFYNADLLDIAKGKKEKTLGYIDNNTLLAIGETFMDMHRTLGRMMERRSGGFAWSKSHNSAFKTTKLVLTDFTRLKTQE